MAKDLSCFCYPSITDYKRGRPIRKDDEFWQPDNEGRSKNDTSYSDKGRSEIKTKHSVASTCMSTTTSQESMSPSNVSSFSIVGGSKAKVGHLERR